MATGLEIADEYGVLDASKRIQKITDCKTVIITLSEKGISYYDNNTFGVMPTKAISVTDVTGAGDTVLASLGYAIAIAIGKTIIEACDFANHAAAVVVKKNWKCNR